MEDNKQLETKQKVLLRVITPAEVKVDQEVDMVIMRATTGEMGVLSGHEARSAVLNDGVMRILNDGVERRLTVFGGMAEIKDNIITVLTDASEWPEEIDLKRAEADRDRSELRLREKVEDAEMQSDQVRLRRSLVRIEVSTYPILNVSK